MAKGYLIAEAKVDDIVAYEAYQQLAQAALAEFGGRYVVHEGAAEVLEGSWSVPRLTIVEFDSLEQAKQFYDSPGYRVAREARQNAATMNVLVVEGLQF